MLHWNMGFTLLIYFYSDYRPVKYYVLLLLQFTDDLFSNKGGLVQIDVIERRPSIQKVENHCFN